jgi:hypothetical protein
MSATFTIEPGIQGYRVLNQHGRTLTSGLPTPQAAQEYADLMNSGKHGKGWRSVVTEPMRKAQAKDRGEVRTANGKTCNTPIKGVKTPVVHSSKPRGY